MVAAGSRSRRADEPFGSARREWTVEIEEEVGGGSGGGGGGGCALNSEQRLLWGVSNFQLQYSSIFLITVNLHTG